MNTIILMIFLLSIRPLTYQTQCQLDSSRRHIAIIGILDRGPPGDDGLPVHVDGERFPHLVPVLAVLVKHFRHARQAWSVNPGHCHRTNTRVNVHQVNWPRL